MFDHRIGYMRLYVKTDYNKCNRPAWHANKLEATADARLRHDDAQLWCESAF